MKKVILSLFAIIAIVSCKSKASTDEIKSALKEGFKEQTNYDVSDVELIKKDDYLYEGFVTLEKDNSKAQVEINLDRDEPTKFIWKVTVASPTMLTDAFDKVNAQLQRNVDSAIAAGKIQDKKDYDSLMKTLEVEPESDDH